MCSSKAARKARSKKDHKEATPVEGDVVLDEQQPATPTPLVHEEGIRSHNTEAKYNFLIYHNFNGMRYYIEHKPIPFLQY